MASGQRVIAQGEGDLLSLIPDLAYQEMILPLGLTRRGILYLNDPALAAHVLRTNFEGPALLLNALAERFAARGSGTLVGVSSVAGDRGRASNYVYGSAKAGFTAFLSGLRNRMARAGVREGPVRQAPVIGLDHGRDAGADAHRIRLDAVGDAERGPPAPCRREPAGHRAAWSARPGAVPGL